MSSEIICSLLPVLYVNPEGFYLRIKLLSYEKALLKIEQDLEILKDCVESFENKVLNELLDDYIELTKIEISYFELQLEDIRIGNDERSRLKSILLNKNELLELLVIKKQGKCKCEKKQLSVDEEKKLKVMYKWAMVKCHPDKNLGNIQLSNTFCKEINKHYKGKDISMMENWIYRIKSGMLSPLHFDNNNIEFYQKRLFNLNNLIENAQKNKKDFLENKIYKMIKNGITINQYLHEERERISLKKEQINQLIIQSSFKVELSQELKEEETNYTI